MIFLAKVENIIEIMGVSEKSWEAAANNAVSKMGDSVKDYNRAEVKESDIKLEDGKMFYRIKLMVSK